MIMKKNLPLIIVTVIIVLGVGGYLLMSRGSGNSQEIEPSTETSQEKTAVEKFTGSLKEAVAMGVGMKCSYRVEGNEYEGYVKGQNYRGKMKSADGKVGEVIMKDNCMWSWSEEEGRGIKTCFEEVDAEVAEGEEAEASLWDQQGSSSDITYTCVPHTVSDSQFTPPSNIQFMDLDSMMQNFGN